MRTLILFICVVSFLNSCKNDFNVQKKNHESDRREAERVLDTFFDNILLDKQAYNLELFSQEFFKQTTKEKLQKEQEFIQKKLGKLLGKELIHWETNVVSGTSPISEYLLVYKIERENYPSVETFYLRREPSDSIKIYSYKIESDGFLREDEVKDSIQEIN